MNPPRPRLLAQFRTDPIVELLRGAPYSHIAENSVIALTANMGPDWRHWIEKPTLDSQAWGRCVVMVPDFIPPVASKPKPDADLVIEDCSEQKPAEQSQAPA